MDRSMPAVSALILTRNEAPNLERLLPALARELQRLGRAHEVVVLDADSPDGTAAVARRHGARVLMQSRPGYANALRQGLEACRGEYIVALDADLSHPPEVVEGLLEAAARADLVVASRYIAGGRADMPPSRRVLSGVLNRVFGVLLRVPTRDLSSGFRVYRRAALAALSPRGEHFDVLPEIAALAHFAGLRVREVAFHYRQRHAGVSKASVVRFAPAYCRTLLRCLGVRRAAPAGEPAPESRATAVHIRPDPLTGPAIAALLHEHLEEMHRHSPPGSVHALDLEKLRAPEITFWSAWDGEALVGCVAIRQLDATHGEIKSMRTATAHQGRGIGAALMRHVLDEAARRGYRRLSLETGSMDAFAPARTLYARFGFEYCAPFAPYADDPHSAFMTRAL